MDCSIIDRNEKVYACLGFDGQVDTCSLIYLALQSLLSRTTGLVIMDEGRAKEHEPSLNYWALDSQNIHSGQVI